MQQEETINFFIQFSFFFVQTPSSEDTETLSASHPSTRFSAFKNHFLLKIKN